MTFFKLIARDLESTDHIMRVAGFELAERYGVLTVRRTGPTAGDCIRVTPSVYTSADDVMKLVKALRSITASPKSIGNPGF